MQIALSALALRQAGLPDFLAAASTAGYDCVELYRQRTEASLVHPDYSVRRIRETLATAGVGLAACEIRPLTGRKADSDERNLAYNLRQVEWDIHLCRALGVHLLGLGGGADTQQARQDLVEGVNLLSQRIDDVVLALGPRAGSCLATMADFEALVPVLPDSMGLWLDTGELLTADVDPVAFTQAWGERVRLVHLRDVRDGETVALGDGDVDIDGVLAALAQAGYAGTIVVEPPADTLAAARERLFVSLGR